jgi:hypothetical protein
MNKLLELVKELDNLEIVYIKDERAFRFTGEKKHGGYLFQERFKVTEEACFNTEAKVEEMVSNLMQERLLKSLITYEKSQPPSPEIP